MKEYQKEYEPKPNNLWQEVNWDGYVQAWARRMEPTEEFEYDKNGWEVSAKLPDDADPTSVKISLSSTDEYGVLYVVSYKKQGSNRWQLLEVPGMTEEGNRIIDFGAHIQGGLEQDVGFHNMARTKEPLEL